MQYYNDNFKYLCIQCYRPECLEYSIYLKSKWLLNKTVICQYCIIAEFCLLCEKSSHEGKCHESSDKVSQEWILMNTKKCPNCNMDVYKDQGCNHITCRCGIHFCWLCRQVYNYNEINEHYSINNDGYININGNTCYGLEMQANTSI